MTEELPTYKRWRENVERWTRQGKALEAIAAQHPEIPFAINPILNQFEWYEHNEDIQTFAARVEEVASIFGTPIKVDTQGGNGEKAPDMRAVWERDDGITVEVRSFRPNCRTHPESEYVPEVHVDAKFPDIHPECADVLKELEDYEPPAVTADSQ
jgi:hypothetical protein